MTIREVITRLEAKLPLYWQESWDNSGVQLGDVAQPCRGVLLCLDVSEVVLAEAIRLGCNLVIAHHPLLFKGLKRIGVGTHIERMVHTAIRHDIVIYAAHTNADNAPDGLNYFIARELGLTNVRPLRTMPQSLAELVTFVPENHLEQVREALWQAGAGQIGAYDSCSFGSQGVGTFRPSDVAMPFVGEAGKLEYAPETRLSVVLPMGLRDAVVKALLSAHPYETPAYSLVTLTNPHPEAGSGVIGDLPTPQALALYLERLKAYFGTDKLMYVPYGAEQIRRVAICGGAGAFLASDARRLGADLFVTGEAKYNDYLDAEGLNFVTVGHYESEVMVTRLYQEILQPSVDVPCYLSSSTNNQIQTI